MAFCDASVASQTATGLTQLSQLPQSSVWVSPKYASSVRRRQVASSQ